MAIEPFTSVGCPRSRKARSETRVEKDIGVAVATGALCFSVGRITGSRAYFPGDIVKAVSIDWMLMR